MGGRQLEFCPATKNETEKNVLNDRFPLACRESYSVNVFYDIVTIIVTELVINFIAVAVNMLYWRF